MLWVSRHRHRFTSSLWTVQACIYLKYLCWDVHCKNIVTSDRRPQKRRWNKTVGEWEYFLRSWSEGPGLSAESAVYLGWKLGCA